MKDFIQTSDKEIPVNESLTLTVTKSRRFPLRAAIGLALIVVFWYLNWNLTGLRTHWGFFPLWLGYCLTADALVYYLKGNSLFTRNYKQYIALYFISIPGWWLFEAFNLRMQNWHYAGIQYFSDSEALLLSSLSFSTVMPAVFSTTELLGIFFKKKNIITNYVRPTNIQLITTMMTGMIILLLILLFPQYFYFLIWIALYFVVDPINAWLGYPNLLSNFFNKNFRPLLILGLGALICGFFWEMWNYYSYPKWEYYLPMVNNVIHVFEMPILGYTGYVPFALELFALYSLISGKRFRRDLLTILD